MPPNLAFFPITPDKTINLLVYCAISAIIIFAAEDHRRLLGQHYERENFNQLIIGELQHRLRNKLATVQAILGRDFRSDNDISNQIAGRLAAIGRADELILKSANRGVEIAEIVTNELQPYGNPSQIRPTGGSLVIPPVLALPLTLIVHELSTNAAKYGALTNPSARIDVNWTVDGTRVQVLWTESGGPAVHTPNHEGFGSELFARALVSFHGKVVSEFAPDGLKCKVIFFLPGSDRTAFGVKRKMIASV